MRYRWIHVAQHGQLQWLLKRNCALAPRHLAVWFLGLAALSLTIAGLFASQGAWMVLSLGKSFHRVECEPAWVRVEYEGFRRSPVRLVAGRERLEVGRFVPSSQRKEFARELRESLARWPAI
ncbi:MAG: DUF2244 domain-containing protein [Quisquiliibacterium sp.]